MFIRIRFIEFFQLQIYILNSIFLLLLHIIVTKHFYVFFFKARVNNAKERIKMRH